MNYQRLHDLIIADARTNPPTGYTESHHIIPRCMGGGNEKTNRVRLTAKQHFVIHHLLTKLYPSHSGIRYAFHLMFFPTTGGKKRSNDTQWIKATSPARTFAFHRPIFAQMVSIEKRGKKRKPFTQETKEKMSSARMGMKCSPEHIANMVKHKIANWDITTPSGEIIRISNLRAYCRANDLDQGAMSRLAKGLVKTHKGYTSCTKV